MGVKVARKFQVTIPSEVREKMDLSVGDVVEVRYENKRIVIDKVDENWDRVMKETANAWSKHPFFGTMNNAVEVVNWLRGKHEDRA